MQYHLKAVFYIGGVVAWTIDGWPDCLSATIAPSFISGGMYQ